MLFLWNNDPTVVIGRHQSAHMECYLPLIQKQNVHLVRRKTGGGAVYHDRGTAIFSFISPDLSGVRSENNSILVRALASLSIDAKATGRNDIEVGQVKVSGSAFRMENNSFLHHGTLLLHTDLNALSSLLRPNPYKLASKGITSVLSRVTNLNLTRDIWETALVTEFLKHHNAPLETPIETLNDDTMMLDPIVANRVKESSSPVWVYGREPDFNVRFEHRFNWGYMDIQMTVESNTIAKCVVYSDMLDITIPSILMKTLTGIPYTRPDILAAMDSTTLEFVVTPQMVIKPILADVNEWIQSLDI